MDNTQITGYRVKCHDGKFVFANSYGQVWTESYEPAPVALADAYRHIADFIGKFPSEPVPTVVTVTRPLTPIETASKELGGLLTSLCKRHGLNLGLSTEQIEKQIAKELADLGAGGSTFVATGIPRR